MWGLAPRCASTHKCRNNSTEAAQRQRDAAAVRLSGQKFRTVGVLGCEGLGGMNNARAWHSLTCTRGGCVQCHCVTRQTVMKGSLFGKLGHALC